MTRYLLYGVEAENVAQVTETIGERIGHPLQGRESEFWGDYWMHRAEGLEIRVFPQPDPYGDLHEDGFPRHRVLIYVDGDGEVPGFGGLATPAGPIELLRETAT